MSTHGPSEHPLQLVVQLQPPDTNDWDHLDRSSRSLLAGLKESTDITDVRFLKGDTIPVGAKSGEAITIGFVALTVLPSLLPRFVDALQAWSLRWRDYKIRIKRQVGDQSLEIEYAPGKTSLDELNGLLSLIAGYDAHGSTAAQSNSEPSAT